MQEFFFVKQKFFCCVVSVTILSYFSAAGRM